jgi:biopolymer transport protein ExbD
MKLKRAKTNVSEMDMTPMIDMTFQLISFFMFVINFNQDLRNETIHLPVAELAKPVEKAKVEPLFLNVNRDGKLLVVGNTWVVDRTHPDMADINEYLRREARLIKANMLRAGRTAEEGLEATVIVRGDRAVQYGVVQDLIRACREAGFTKFSLRAEREAK